MSHRLVISDQAEADLEEIADHIANDNPHAAARVVSAILQKCDLIALQPEIYPMQADIAPGFRRALARPYGIWFQVLGAEVRIERIVHGARDIPALLGTET